MAIFKKNNFRILTGLIGPMIVSTWKGIMYTRAKPRKSEVKKQGTPGQIAARGKFGYLHQFLRPFHRYLMIGFSGKAIRKTEINAAFTSNYHHAVIGVFPNLSIDYSKLLVSAGKLSGLILPSLSCNTEGLMELSWKADWHHQEGEYDDHLLLILYSELHKSTDGFIGHAQRRDGYCSFPVRKEMQKGRIHVYVGLTSQNRRLASNSQYLGVWNFNT